MTCLRILLPVPPVPASQMKTPMFERVPGQMPGAQMSFSSFISRIVYTAGDRLCIVYCSDFCSLRRWTVTREWCQFRGCWEKKRHWWTEVCLLCLFNVKSVTYVAFTVGCLPECFAHMPRREGLATSVFTAAGWVGVLLSRSECHHASSTSTCLSLSYFYIFF